MSVIIQVINILFITYLIIFICREINNSEVYLYKGKSLLTNEFVYGELCCDYNIDIQNNNLNSKHKYYIREYYIDSNYNLKYIDHRIVDTDSI